VQQSATKIQQDTCDLLFELSNLDRLNILLEIKKTPMRISHVSKKFKSTIPETSRNISRLHSARLINRDSQGIFHLSPYGEEALSILQGFFFISNHRSYFENHTPSALPQEFATGIGSLLDSDFTGDVTKSMFNVEKTIRESQEYILVMVDQLLANGVQLVGEAITRGVEFKKISQQTMIIPPEIQDLVNNPVFQRGARAKKAESRYLEKVDVTIITSEKELAILAFPNFEGKFDFVGFHSTNESALNWARSLFFYYWNKAKP
jgi:predicted transcriptional regulator